MSKKIISVILVLCIALSCFSFSFTATAASSVPIVYVTGQGAEIYTDTGKVVYDGDRVPTDIDIAAAAKELIPLFIGAVTLGQWSKYRNAVLDLWKPIYEEIALDNNGEPTHGTNISWNWNINNITPTYTLGSYHFAHDWRLDPFANAAKLKDYIEAIKTKTGSSKVNIVGRCEGCAVVYAYLAEYGYDDVNCVEFYVSAVNNIDANGALYSGELYLDPVILQKFYEDRIDIGDEELSALLDTVVDYLVDSYGFEGACKMLLSIMPRFYKEVGSDLFLSSYGSFPGMWATVGPKYYAKARKIIFAGKEEEYAGLIEKLDKYDVKVRQRIDDIILEAKEAGVKVGVFTKYGDFNYNAPICEEVYELNDNASCLACESFGATCSRMDATLSNAYLEKADPKYISPDNRVDASTCVTPDTTWFNYNSIHNDFSEATNRIMKWFFDNNGEVTVFSDPAYPQFYVSDDGYSIRPMTADDVTVKYEKEKTPRFIRVFQKLGEFIKAVFNFLKNLMSK